MKTKLGENINDLEGFQQGSQSIVQDSLTKDSSASDASDIDNTDGCFSEEITEKHSNSLELLEV